MQMFTFVCIPQMKEKSATLASERPELYGLRKHELVGNVFMVGVYLGLA